MDFLLLLPFLPLLNEGRFRICYSYLKKGKKPQQDVQFPSHKSLYLRSKSLYPAVVVKARFYGNDSLSLAGLACIYLEHRMEGRRERDAMHCKGGRVSAIRFPPPPPRSSFKSAAVSLSAKKGAFFVIFG